METRVLPFSDESIAEAARLILAGEPVAIATETVYGLAADATNANASGSLSPTRAEHVMKSLGGRIPLIVDAGPTERGVESTIVAATGGALRLLRPGPIEVDAVPSSGNRIEAPGQLASHYAPSK